MISTIIKQEFCLIFKKFSDLINPLIFFVIAISIFAISLNNLSDNFIQNQINLSVIWVCLVFSIIIGVNNSFQKDFKDGSLEQLFLSKYLFEFVIFTKIFSNWLIYSLPLILSIPLISIFLKLDYDSLNLILIFSIVTLIINFISSFCSSLIISSNSSHSLLTILVLPLSIPIIIFANSAFIDLDKEFFDTSLKFLIAILFFLTPILTFASASAIRLSLD